MTGAWVRLGTRLVVARPALAALTALLVLAVLGAGITRLEVRTGYRGMFRAEDPLLTDIEALNQRYAAGDGLLFVVHARDGSILSESGLAAIRALTEGLRRIPSARAAMSLSTARRAVRTAFGMIPIDVLPKRPPSSAAALAKLRRTVMAQPSITGSLISADGAAALVRAEFDLARGDSAQLTEIMDRARLLKQQVETAAPGLRVALGGLVALNSAFVEAAARDARLLFPVMAGLLCFGLWLFTRSWRGVAGPLVVVIAAVTVAMGAAGWLEVPITPVLSIAPTIILGIGIADSLHILVGADRARASGLGSSAALYRALRRNVTPVFLTTLTTAIGFLSLLFSKSPPFRDLGLVTAIGVVAALFFTMTLLPLIGQIAPGRIRSRFHRIERLIGRVAAWSDARRGLALGLTLIMVVVAVAGFRQARIDDRFSQWFDRSTVFRQDLDRIRQSFGPTERTSWVVPLRGGLDSVDAGLLRQLDAFSGWLSAQPEVSHVVSLSSVLSGLTGSLPDDRARKGDLAVLRRLTRPGGKREAISSLLAIGGEETRLLVTLSDGSTRALHALAGRARQWLAARAGPLDQARIAGPAWSLAALVRSSTEAMLTGTAIAFVLITLCLGLFLRSPRLGLAGLVAMTVPPALVYGLWSLSGRVIGLSESVVGATSLGLLVDASIHLLVRCRDARLRGKVPSDLVRRAFEAAGPALLGGFLILIAGFAVLILSPFQGNQHFGLLTASTLAVGILVALLVLPSGVKRP